MLNIMSLSLQLLALLVAALTCPLHQTGRPAETDQHSGIICCQRIKDIELRSAEPLGQQPDAQRDERGDEHGEADCGDGLRDCDCCGYGDKLDCYEQDDLAAGDEQEGVALGDEARFREKEEGLAKDAVRFNGSPLCDVS
jgi:hypothetical protein